MEIDGIGKKMPTTKADLNDLCIDAFGKQMGHKKNLHGLKKLDLDED
jgi:hypothetical protein